VLLSRSPSAGPYKSVSWDAAASGAWSEVLEGADAVVNLAGERLDAGRWNPQRKKSIVESRIHSTRTLVAGLSAVSLKPRVLINASAIGFYGESGDKELDESSPRGSGFLSRLCSDWESEARTAEVFGLRVVCLRLGVVLGPGGGALSKMLPIFKLCLGGSLGSGKQWMSWITLEDTVRSILYAATSALSGPVNAVSPHPCRNFEFSKALGRALGRPAILPAPALALRLALGEMSSVILSSQRVVPKRLLESGFKFSHETLQAALAYCVTG
jgi:hypothetical protein